MRMATAAILGCAGYTGQETLDRVLGHPALEPIALGSDSLAGQPASTLDPRLNSDLPRFVTNAEALAAGAEVVFVCLGHEEAAALEPPAAELVIDLSGAHRLRDATLYPEWYGFTHPRPGAWSYGLPELFTPVPPLVANPGCYATATLLALAPLVEAIDRASVVVDAKSGVSGAGRGLKAASHAGFVLENLTPYRVGTHQHAPEIEQALGFPVCFAPHLLPVRRGLLVTCYVQPQDDLRVLLEAAYEGMPAVRVLDDGMTPELSRVQHTDAAEIALYEDRATGRAVVVCVIDNLGKGAAGNAVQNVNVALGFDETAGLRLTGVLV
jgi:N-acetyl-gamma-glutamyl-phosphate reductase